MLPQLPRPPLNRPLMAAGHALDVVESAADAHAALAHARVLDAGAEAPAGEAAHAPRLALSAPPLRLGVLALQADAGRVVGLQAHAHAPDQLCSTYSLSTLRLWACLARCWGRRLSASASRRRIETSKAPASQRLLPWGTGRQAHRALEQAAGSAPWPSAGRSHAEQTLVKVALKLVRGRLFCQRSLKPSLGVLLALRLEVLALATCDRATHQRL